MGWERKRGKIEEFNRLLRGATDTSFLVSAGDVAILPSVRYCITLDSDTRLPRDAARQLIGIITHPLNRPTMDPRLGRVTDGYGILQPRVSVTFSSAAGSLFARLYSGHTGVDPYTTAVSDTYQDLFAEGIFTGKGLYDVDAFMASLDDCVPENALLSHDLFEGLHARVALVSDVEFVDEYPSSVLAHARRQHRWIRGDWQILFWLFPFVPSRHGIKRNSLPLIGRWKILDNLRRSLVTPMLLAMLVAAWTVLPGPQWFWMMTALTVIASQLLPLLGRLLVGPRQSQSFPVFWRNLREDAATATAQIALGVTLLAYNAWTTAHAIVVTLVRLAVTGRRLLEWETAASSIARASGLVGRKGVWNVALEMIASPIIAVIVTVMVLAARRGTLASASPFLLLWFMAPAVAYWLSLPVGARQRPLADAERRLLRRTARKTWRYFETFVTADTAWLPPDNYQETGSEAQPAPRTSPTNIAMGLLVGAGRARPRISLDWRAGLLARSELDDAGGARTPRRALPQLVRHEDACAAAAAVRLDRRQREPGSVTHRPRGGAGAVRRGAADRVGPPRRRHRHRRCPGRRLVEKRCRPGPAPSGERDQPARANDRRPGAQGAARRGVRAAGAGRSAAGRAGDANRRSVR